MVTIGRPRNNAQKPSMFYSREIRLIGSLCCLDMHLRLRTSAGPRLLQELELRGFGMPLQWAKEPTMGQPPPNVTTFDARLVLFERRFSTITRKPPKKLAVIDCPSAIYPTRNPAEIGDSIEYRMRLNLVALTDKVAELDLDEDVSSDIDQLLSIASDMRC